MSSDNNCNCGCNSTENNTDTITIRTIMPSMPDSSKESACCGTPSAPPANPFEKAGYRIQHYVDDFIHTKIGFIPKVKTTTGFKDFFQTSLNRLNIGREDYKVAPGLYCTGTPDENAPILVTSNYKLTFDYLRDELTGFNTWVLVLDTRGINVWCAAGKGTFATEELAEKIKSSKIKELVKHRNVIVPQLGATGVNGRLVKKITGFKVIWGPVNLKDLTSFLNNDLKTDQKMRELTFTLKERAVLVPVELALTLKPAMYIFIATLILSGFGQGFFSLSAMWDRGFPAILTIISGIVAGAAITPILLPRLPGVAFSLKGIVAGLCASIPVAVITAHNTGIAGVTALVLVSVSLSSFLGMNFTGSTPYTSPSGVEKEMRIAIPLQIGAIIIGIILWVYSAL